jgi:hypothetical protein
MITINRTVRGFFIDLNENLLFILSIFLLVFIPLFPKIPLFDILPGYIVRVRPEDFLVVCTGLIWLRDVRAKRITWNSSYFWFVGLYGVVGMLSILLGTLLLQTIPPQIIHLGKSGLHFFRYLEYFSLFFFCFSAIKTKRQVMIALAAITLTVVGVVGYGVGQKYLHFPVYSTMNREYSKGEKLYLQEGARPQSTFAGHYDLAAFLVIVLPLLFSVSFSTQPLRSPLKISRILLFLTLQSVHLLGFVMLILSGSKMSFLGYVLGMGFVVLFHLLRLPTLRQRVLAIGLILIAGLISVSIGWLMLPQSLKTKVTDLTSKVQQPSDRPADLVGDGYENKIVQTTAPDGTPITAVVREKSDWSENALKYGLSMGIRLDTLWPQALLGFARNPLTGSGYGTLAMLDSHRFIEADSTDNNFLRTLGETGLLGFITFYGIVFFLFIQTLRRVHTLDSFIAAVSIGFTGSLIGLAVSAIYLDVFAASKVAFTFWAFAGILMKTILLGDSNNLSQNTLLKPIKAVRNHFLSHWPIYVTILLSFFLFHQNPYMEHNPTKDIEQFTASVEQLTSARCFLEHGRFSLCRNNGIILSSHFSIYSVLLVPFLALTNQPGTFYYLNMLLILMSLFLSYRLLRNRTKPQIILTAMLTALFVASLFPLTQSPLTTPQFFFVIIGIPLVIHFVSTLLERPDKKTYLSVQLQRSLLICLILFLGSKLLFGDLTHRFRNISGNFAFRTVELSNALVVSTPTTPAYFISTLNPYFIDLYSMDQYTALPLSLAQPYTNSMFQVWGIANSVDLHQLYTSLLSNKSKLFASDYGLDNNPTFTEDFKKLKQAYTLEYISLGCNEHCNFYNVHTAQPLVSPDPISVFNEKKLVVKNIPKAYQFTVISHRFDPKLAAPNTEIDTLSFVKKIAPLTKISADFMILTGDAIHTNNNTLYQQKFRQQFVDLVQYPILYNPGNYDILASKQYATGFETFFTDSDYFIMLDIDKDSHIDSTQQLKLYTKLLELEKLPRIKNLFIIANDLNWQDQTDPKNAIHIIERKLATFPDINTFIITANHNSNLGSQDNWFETVTNKNVTYVSSLTAGNTRDVYLEIKITEDGEVEIHEAKNLTSN